MIKEFEKVMNVTNRINQASPQTREELVKGLESAKAAQQSAIEAKLNAETEKELDIALDDERRAIYKVAFFQRQLDKLDYTPRMAEAEYYDSVQAVEDTMKKAADAFRKTALDAMEKLVLAWKDYQTTTKDADFTLEALDSAANVLQSKHRYKILDLQNMDALKIEAPDEWRRHAVRYGSGKAYSLCVRDESGEYDKYAVTAWKAASQIAKDERRPF